MPCLYLFLPIRIRHQSHIAGALDSFGNLSLMLETCASAFAGEYLEVRRTKTLDHRQILIINVFESMGTKMANFSFAFIFDHNYLI